MSIFNKKTGIPLLLVAAGLLSFGYLFFSLSENNNFRETATKALQVVRQSPGQLDQSNNDNSEPEPTTAVQTAADSDEAAVYAYTASSDGQTPFSLLIESEDVAYEEYDFGVFVNSINGQSGNDDYFWALYVNGEMANKAGDQIELEPGDKVEWRWEEVATDFSE